MVYSYSQKLFLTLQNNVFKDVELSKQQQTQAKSKPMYSLVVLLTDVF